MSSIDNYEFIDIKKELIEFGCYETYSKNITFNLNYDIDLICQRIMELFINISGEFTYRDYNRLYRICMSESNPPITNLTKKLFSYDNIFRLPPYDKLIFMDDFYFNDNYISTSVTFYDKNCYATKKTQLDNSLKYFYIIMLTLVVYNIIFSLFIGVAQYTQFC